MSDEIADHLLNAVSVTRASGGPQHQMLIAELVKNRVLLAGTTAPLFVGELGAQAMRGLVGFSTVPASVMSTIASLGARDAGSYAAVARLLAQRANYVEGSLPLIRDAALRPSLSDSVRAQLIDIMVAMPGRPGLEASTGVLSKVNPAITPAGTAATPIETSWRRFVGDRRRLQELDYFVDLSRSADSSARTLAFAVLLQSVRGGRAAPAVNEKVQPVLAAAWASRAAAADLVRAVSIMRVESAYGPQREAYRARSGVPSNGVGPAASSGGARGAAGDGAALNWQTLFNGRDLKDSEIKFTNHPLGENFRNTFRVENGLLTVRYDGWPDFNGEFGHIFYKQPFSHYIVAVEYRFTGEQATGAGRD
ncbi:MAG: hypothetical protein H7Z40_08305 [Phycisphaerae bacterium]|nr:hypothetical protein [Gemmatimonadaceae bacterium]